MLYTSPTITSYVVTKHMNDTFTIIRVVSGYTPLYKNSLQYECKDWREYEKLDVYPPVQRELCRNECVLDFDNVSAIDKQVICDYYKNAGLKFWAWESSESGLHIHFWVDIIGKQAKKKLVAELTRGARETLGIACDIQPMSHGVIRAEHSASPKHGFIKREFMQNLPVLNPINNLSPQMKQLVMTDEEAAKHAVGRVGAKNGKAPKCVKYMLSHQFTDGRVRILFALISFWKASKVNDIDILSNATAWCQTQKYYYPKGKLIACIKSSNGRVGCAYRHSLLEELGVCVDCQGYE